MVDGGSGRAFQRKVRKGKVGNGSKGTLRLAWLHGCVDEKARGQKRSGEGGEWNLPTSAALRDWTRLGLRCVALRRLPAFSPRARWQHTRQQRYLGQSQPPKIPARRSARLKERYRYLPSTPQTLGPSNGKLHLILTETCCQSTPHLAGNCHYQPLTE